MVRARKAVGDKLILDDVTMAFLPGAKIGVVGPNGAGKSTILKIMAGLDTPSNGEAKLTPGFSVGILMQEPVLDESKTVLENVQEGVGPIKGQARPVQRDLPCDGRAGCRFRHASCRNGITAGRNRCSGCLGPRFPARAGNGCPANASRRHGRITPVRGREEAGRAVQAASPEARPAPAGRTDQPPRRRERALARTAPRQVPRRRACRNSRSLLP